MNRLRYYQDTVFFFLLAFLLLSAGLSLFSSNLTLSHPLKVIQAEHQEDGGIPELSG